MEAERLIALEAALAELADLYAVARTFASLHAIAERDLLPELLDLGAALRARVRRSELTEAEVDTTAHRIVALRSAWRDTLAELRASDLYRKAVAAIAEHRQAALPELLPRLLADLRVLRPAPELHFPVSLASGRRQVARPPFLGPSEAVERIERILCDGLRPGASAKEWWERDLPSIPCARCAAELDTPCTLRIARADVAVSVFEQTDASDLLVFTPLLRAPMTVVLAPEATDSWWETHEEPYEDFRRALADQLGRRGHAVALDQP